MHSRSIRRARVVASLSAASLLLGAVPAFAATPSGDEAARLDASAFAGDIAAGQLLVTTAAAGDTSFAAGASVDGSAVTAVADRVQLVAVEPGSELAVAEEIAAQEGVVAVSPSARLTPHLVPDDEFYPEQWSHQRTNAEAGWDIDTGSSDVAVTVIDSGVNAEHEDLDGRIGEQLKAENGTVVPGDEGNNDTAGHGTAVAGVLGAATNNGTGIAGVDWAATLNDIDIFAAGGFDSDLIAAIAWAADNGQDVINLSLGSIEPRECAPEMQAVIDQATAAGATVVASSGNAEDPDLPPGEYFPGESFSPSNCDGVVTVGATNNADERAVYSTQNEFVDVTAPGGEGVEPSDSILTTSIDGAYTTVNGTSFSAPYVSGVAALIKSVNAELSPEQVGDILRETAVHPEGEERTDAFGFGIVDVAAALDAADDDDPEEPRDERRIYGDDIDNTDVAEQAVAASQEVFGDGEATHVVLARGDDYADALAGSTLTLGSAPVLYTGSTGGLPDATAAEIDRVLADGGLVLVLGGEAAVPVEAVEQLEGYEVERVEGPSRGETAEAAAGKVVELLGDAEGVILAKAFDWPDAVTAGSLGVQYDYPVLLTGYGEDQVDELHPSAARAIEAVDPDVLITVGGAGAVGEDAEREAADIGDVPEENIIRLGGGSRLETAVEVAGFIHDDLGPEGLTAYGVNVRTDDGYAHILSTSANVAATGGFYIPFEGDDGSRYLDEDTTFVREFVQDFVDPSTEGRVVGGRDVIVDEALEAFFDDLGSAEE